MPRTRILSLNDSEIMANHRRQRYGLLGGVPIVEGITGLQH